MNSLKLKTLVSSAKKAQKMSYCPYSRYPVGAAVLTDSGRIYTGANVENASYGLSLCAERVAIFNAISRGEKGLKAVCVVGRSAKPCGACRQVMLEFSNKDTLLLLVDVSDTRRRETITRSYAYDMLPSPFDPLDSGLLPSPQNLLRRLRRDQSGTPAKPRPKGHPRRAARRKRSRK